MAVEALACGTPVISTDNPGGLELNELFGADVAIVPREQPPPLAAAITRLPANKRRTLPGTQATRSNAVPAAAVAAQYLGDLSTEVTRRGRGVIGARCRGRVLSALLGARWVAAALLRLGIRRSRSTFDSDPPRLVTGVYPAERDARRA